MSEMGIVEIGPGFEVHGANGLGIVEIGPGFEVHGAGINGALGAYDDVSLVGAGMGAYDQVSLVGAFGETDEKWYQKPMTLALIGGGVLVAGLGAWMLMRQR